MPAQGVRLGDDTADALEDAEVVPQFLVNVVFAGASVSRGFICGENSPCDQQQSGWRAAGVRVSCLDPPQSFIRP
jgi:hypothetical protein